MAQVLSPHLPFSRYRLREGGSRRKFSRTAFVAWTVQNPTKFGRLVDFPTHSALPPSLSPSNPTLCPPLIRVAAFFRVFDGFLLIIDHDFGRAAADAQGTPELPPVAKAAGAPVPVALSRDWTRFGRCSTTIYAEHASHHSL